MLTGTSTELDFNPRTHEECDKHRQMMVSAVLRFQSTHSRGVRLRTFVKREGVIKYFNPRTHEECDAKGWTIIAAHRYFNPRTHEECDRSWLDSMGSR